MAIALVVTSITPFRVESRADEFISGTAENQMNLSKITADVDIVNGGNQQVLNALRASTYEIDGIIYNNYSTYNGVSASASSEKDDANKAIDGSLSSRWESEHGVDPQYLAIDFGNQYMLKDIAIYWEGASAKEYDVEVSQDGLNFQTLTSVTNTYGKRTDDIKFSEEISVRAVKIHCKSRNTVYGDSIYEIGFYGTSPQGEVVPTLSDLQVKDYYKYTGKYFIYFTEPEESSGYNVYVDDIAEPVKKINSSGEYLSSQDLEGYDAGTHTMYVANIGTDGRESAKISKKFTVGEQAGTYTNIPQIYIYTDKNITNEYHEDGDVTISVIDKDGGNSKAIYESAGNIKIRGNTTAGAPKKPWNIKLSSKKSVLGMDKGKKWCLLANSFDKSLMRNSLAYDFGLQNGVTYTSQSRFVEVYINGKYNGNYLITEPVEAKTERVDIDAYNADSNDILLELGTRNEPDVDHFTTGTLRTTFDVNDPEKGDDLTDAQVDEKIARVNQYLTEFESVLRNQDYDEISNYIDEDTFINFYIVNELFKNVDFNFSSTRFYIKDNKIYAGPLWDFDLSSGNCKSSYYTDYYTDGVSYKGFYCQSMNWYRQLIKNETFYNKVKERYKNLQYIIQNIYKNTSETTLSIDYLVNTYGASFERNYRSTDLLGAGWSLTNEDGYSYSAESGWNRWEQPVEFLRNWLQNRNIWICEQWGIDLESAYEESKPVVPEEPETPTNPEQTTEGNTNLTNKIVAFEYDGTNAVAGADMVEYADPDDDYTYHATTGNGTMRASVTGTNLKHIEWGDPADYGVAVPIMTASTKNPWSIDAYVSYTFTTISYNDLKVSIDVGGTKKGPANLLVGYYEEDAFQTITTYTISKNKTMYTIDFDLPENLENQGIVTIYVKLANTTNIGGSEMLSDGYITGGELAINNFVVIGTSENPAEPETTTPMVTESDTPEQSTPEPGIPESSTPKPSDQDVVTTPDYGNVSEPTSLEPSVSETTASDTMTEASAKSSDVNVGKTKVKKVSKKLTSKKAKVSLKKIKGASGYKVKISTSRKFKKKKTVTKTFKKAKFTFKSKKIRNKRKLYIKARAFRTVKGVKCFGKWSKTKKIKLKKK